MENMAIKMVQAYFESKEIRVNVLRDDLLAVGLGFDNGTMKVYLHFNEDSSVHLEGVEFIKVAENKYDVMYKVLNEINDKYRFVKFVLDTEEGQLNARTDGVIQLDTCGEECFELMIRMMQIVDDAYPTIMKAMWS